MAAVKRKSKKSLTELRPPSKEALAKWKRDHATKKTRKKRK